MEMLSSATKMDIFPTFLQSEKDFDEDFNYITSSGTTLGEMLSTENFLESYGYDSKSPDDIFADDVVYDANDFVAIIKQEPGFEYHDYQMNTSPESELSSYEDQVELVNASNDLMSVDVEYLMKMQQAPTLKQENENVVIKVEAIDSNLFTDESVPVFSHEVSAELSTSNGLQYLFEGGIVKAEKEFDWKTGFEDIDCVVPSLFMDTSSGHHASQVVIKSEPTVKNENAIKHEVAKMSKSPSLNESFGNASTDEINIDEIVRRSQTDSNNRIKNSDSKRSAPEIVGKSNKKLKKPDGNEDGDERLKKAVNNVKLRQQKKFEEGRLREQKRREEEFQKKARERAQYFSKQIASGALQLKPVEEKEEKKTGCLQKKRGRKPKAVSSPERSPSVNAIPVAVPSDASSLCKVNSLSNLCSNRSSKGNAVQLTTQPSSASLVISTSQHIKSVGGSLSKRSPKANAVLLSSSVTSTLCQMKVTSTTSVKRSPSASSLPSSLPSDISTSSQVKSHSILPSKRSPTVNDVSLVASSSLPVTAASSLIMKTDGIIRRNSAGSLLQSAGAALVTAKVSASCTGERSGKMSSILSTSNMKPQLTLAKGGISILKSPAAHTSPAVANSSSKTLSACSSDTLVTFASKAQTSLLKSSQMPIMAGTSVLKAPPPAQFQNLLPNQGKCPGVQSSKFGSVSPAVAQNSRVMASPGQKTWTGANKMPDVISGNKSPLDLVKSETAETTITRSAECQLVAENKESKISKHELESKQSSPDNIMDDANQSNQVSTAGTVLLTDSTQDGNNNEKKKENKKRLNLSEYMNRLKERSKNETSESKPQVMNESRETKPCMTNENLDSSYSVLDEHNYCIRSKQPGNDLQSERTNSSESSLLTSGKMIISVSDGTVFHLKARMTAPASIATASTKGINCNLPSDVSTLSASKIQSVYEQTCSSRPVPSVTTSNDYGSLQPRNPVTRSSYSSPLVPVKNSVNGKIFSNCGSSQPGIAFNHNQDVTSWLHSTITSSRMVNYASDHVKARNHNQVASYGVPDATSVGGKVSCASNSTSARQWKLIPHNLQATPVVSFRNAIGQKIISSNDHQSSQLEKANLNQVDSPHLPSVTSNAGNVISAFGDESSQPSKVISHIQVTSQEYNSHQPFSDASGSQSTCSTSSENSTVNQSCRVPNSVADSLPSNQLLVSSCALTSVSAEEKTQDNHCALSSSPSTSGSVMNLSFGSVNRDNIHRIRTSRNWRRSRSSRSSRSSSSDSCRSRSPIRQQRRSRDESSSSSYSSRSPSRQRNHRDYRRNDRRNWYEKNWRSDGFMLDEKDKIREKKIYVGGIPDDCTPSELKEKFKQFGEITKVSVHPQTEQENYGFLTFRYTKDALRVKEEGHKVAGCEGFHFCYGDRRAFCKEDYKDFDNMWNQSWDDDLGYHAKPKQSEDAAFEDMLKAHQRDQRRKKH